MDLYGCSLWSFGLKNYGMFLYNMLNYEKQNDITIPNILQLFTLLKINYTLLIGGNALTKMH